MCNNQKIGKYYNILNNKTLSKQTHTSIADVCAIAQYIQEFVAPTQMLAFSGENPVTT